MYWVNSRTLRKPPTYKQVVLAFRESVIGSNSHTDSGAICIHFGSIFETLSQCFDFSARSLGHVKVWLAEIAQEARNTPLWWTANRDTSCLRSTTRSYFLGSSHEPKHHVTKASSWEVETLWPSLKNRSKVSKVAPLSIVLAFFADVWIVRIIVIICVYWCCRQPSYCSLSLITKPGQPRRWSRQLTWQVRGHLTSNL